MKAVITIAIIAAILSVMFGSHSSNDKPQTWHDVHTSQKCNDGIQGVAKNPQGSVNYNYYMREMDKFC